MPLSVVRVCVKISVELLYIVLRKGTYMKKKRKKKQPAKISQHEDAALKVTAQFFRDEIMPALNIEGTVVSILPTEEIHLELKKGFEDFNYLMSDDSIKHFEFQSTNEGIRGLKRFRTYESQMSYKYKKAVTTYVLFSGSIQHPMTEFTEGVNTYRVVPIIMQDKNADKEIAELRRKQEAAEKITKADLLPLVLSPLMSGQMSQKERVSAAYEIMRRATEVDAEIIRKVEAVIYIMADKFLDSKEMEQLKEEIKMTRLGKMLYEDGAQTKLKEQVKKKVQKGCSVDEIADMLEEEVGTIEQIIKQL